ncbi:MAG: hypothetical protein Q9171_004842 [Xanthocarpia ochracea]
MGPTGSKALLLLCVRIGQVLINIAYVITIGLTSADSGRWTYKSIELAAALGATAATLTFVNFFVYLTRLDPNIRPVAGYGSIKRILRLVVRISIDVSIATLWGLAFIASFHRKSINFQKLFALPPYKTWAPAVVFTLIEWWVRPATFRKAVLTCSSSGLLLASAFIVLANYRSLPPKHATTRLIDTGSIDPSDTGDAVELVQGGTFGASIVRQA